METIISVVIPTYNRHKLIVRCLDSLASQDLPKERFEVIVVSDGPDSTLQKLLSSSTCALNLRYLSTPEKKGPAAARNIGWLSAKSPLIAFTDDDCIPTVDWLSGFLTRYQQEELIAFSGKTTVPLSEQPTDYELNLSNLETADFITANCLCTKRALMFVGGFDERYKTAWREDSDLEFKFIERKIPIKKVPGARVIHPVRKALWGVSVKEQKKVMYDALLYKKFPGLYREKIRPQPLWDYYLLMLLFVFILISIYVRAPAFFSFFTIVFFLLMIKFIWKRIKHSKKSAWHIFEMIATSLAIPFLSIYWRQYGAIKHRVFFL